MELKKIKRIHSGATVGIFSPSEPITESRLPKFNSGLQILEKYGFKIKLGENCKLVTNFTAGSIDERLHDINSLLQDDDVDFLLSSWGGKSCNQLIKRLDYDLISKKRKAILGFSDPCVLANNISAKTGLVSFYGPNVVGKLNETENANFNILIEDFKNKNLLLDNNNWLCIRKGQAKGKIIGGNLSTFSLGVLLSDLPLTYYDDSILIWEDLGNPPQIICQYLQAMENYGVLDRINGMVIGYFKSEDEKFWKRTDHFDALNTILGKYDFPILYNPIFGHANLPNPIFPIGAKCLLNSESNTLVLSEKIIE